ncbi:Sugar transferase [Rubrivivax sp. A210]|uniref:TIGR03088 family PEP-CTERM/XrtA system glycosyltransferase n=1 Tax=Rubrivivax sp. A210 TaxID=2772301 RepID=UPI00191B2D74|nr:TIGR03088 family PEP-CTERM/XrtA system glycosyltransferase [Rubrivivax sp. A210]CAD5375213.1 Sugar transferase [Rubrivivax sp. A210]
MGDTRPLVLHVVYRFAVGGLENGVVNLINRMAPARWRHGVLALTEVDPGFARRIVRDDVSFTSLHKPPGQGLRELPRLWRAFRELRPAVVHTRNIAALEAQLPAWLAGVPARVHGEHGRDMADLHLTNRNHRWTRRAYRPFVQHYVALSRDLAEHLQHPIGVPSARISQLYNGVDTERFAPAPQRGVPAGCPFVAPGLFVFGTVGRMQAVKAQTHLAQAFVRALQQAPGLRERLRLVLAGEGPLRAECEAILRDAGVSELAWFAGERSDVPDVMRGLDCFVLPSLGEGISNTILEAMASGLPVLATKVGGNADLVADGSTGRMVAVGDVQAMADAMLAVAADVALARAWGLEGRQQVQARFSLTAMVNAYEGIYSRLLGRTNKD